MSPRSAVLARPRRVLIPLLAAGAALATAVTSAPAAHAASSRPATPSGFTTSVSSTGTYLTWYRASVSGYQVEQSAYSNFKYARLYRIRWNAGSFTPYGLTRGHTYWFRVRAYTGSSYSGWSATRTATPTTAMQLVRVMTYNTLAAAFDNTREGSGRVASYGSRVGGQVYLIKASNADAIAVQEGSTCLIHYKSKPCWREVDSLTYHLGSNYALANTDTGPRNRYAGNYIIYKKSVLAPYGTGGNVSIGDGASASYQILQARATGARFLFVTVHLLAPRGRSYDAKRGNETLSMVKWTTAHANAWHLPVVYGGDFNTYLGEWHTVDSSGSTLMNSRINDAITVAPALYSMQYDSFNGYYRTPPRGGHTLDHIYASNGVALTTLGQLLRLSHGKFYGTIPSDHNPLDSYVQIPYTP